MTESARARIHAMFNLDETAETELNARLDAYRVEVLIQAGVEYEDCPVCGAAQAVGRPCNTCAFKARIAAETGARVTVPAPAAEPDFFEPGHTYAHQAWHFRCDALTTDPNTSEKTASGWLRIGASRWKAYSYSEAEWGDDWTDVTEGEARNA